MIDPTQMERVRTVGTVSAPTKEGDVSTGEIAENPWAAGVCWIGAPFGGLIPVVLLAVTWGDRVSLVRRHALAATALWCVLIAIYLPAFVFGLFIPAFNRESPPSWAIAVVAGVVVVSWAATVIGVSSVIRTVRRRSAASVIEGAS